MLKKRGNSNREIAEALGRDRKTVKRVLEEPTDKKLKKRKRKSIVDDYEDDIRRWIQEDIPVTVMIERARKNPKKPYQGGTTVFYDRARLIRQELQMTKKKAIWRERRITRRVSAGRLGRKT